LEVKVIQVLLGFRDPIKDIVFLGWDALAWRRSEKLLGLER
jgi:hypothetical protein